jgi:integrase
MVVRVRLKGLKIARNPKGLYYVYIRATGECLVKAFDGDRAALLRRLEEPGIVGAYNVQRHRDAGPKSYPDGTLGALVKWFTNPENDDDAEHCPEFEGLTAETQATYKDRLAYLEPGYDTLLETITSASIYLVRNRAAADKWPSFADKMVTAMSSMFTAAVKVGKMPSNPALGVERIHKTDHNANREWRPEEWETVKRLAPQSLLTTYMIARYAGYRSQSTIRVSWPDYQDDPTFGKCFRFRHRKNDEIHWLPVVEELQAYLASLKVRTKDGPIALRHNGQPWASAKQLQKQSSNFLKGLERKGLVGSGLTEHGLRATFAAARKREEGANDSQVAAALGDRDTRMGAHYSRHVENETKVIQAFGGAPKRPKKAK